jgi:hypothetical protein
MADYASLSFDDNQMTSPMFNRQLPMNCMSSASFVNTKNEPNAGPTPNKKNVWLVSMRHVIQLKKKRKEIRWRDIRHLASLFF